MKNICITVDIESDWGGRLCADQKNEGIENILPNILSIFEDYGVYATFFVTTDILLKYKKEIAMIKRNHHEIAWHGFYHKDVTKISTETFIKEIEESKRLFQQYLGVDLKGFRAPQFKCNKQILLLLKKYGFQYDSSYKYRRTQMTVNNIDQIPVRSSRLPLIPSGILWINAVGINIYIKWLQLFGISNPAVFYMHLFDFLSSKSRDIKGVMNPIVRIWYRFRQKHGVNTLRELLDYLTHQNIEYSTCSHVVAQKSNKLI